MRRSVRKKETYDWTADEKPTERAPLPVLLPRLEIQPEEDEVIAVEVVPQYDPFEEHRIQLAREQRERQREINRQEASLPFELARMEHFTPSELGVKSNVIRPKIFDDLDDNVTYQVEEEEEDVRGRVAEMGVEEEVFESLRGNQYQMTAHPDATRRNLEFNPIEDEEALEWEEQQLRKVKLTGIRPVAETRKSTKSLAHIPLEQQLINLQAEQADLEASIHGMREQLYRLEGRVIVLEAEAALETQRAERNAFYRQLTLMLQKLDRESQMIVQQLEAGETPKTPLTPASVVVEALSTWMARDPVGYEQAHAHLYLTQLLEPHARIAMLQINDLDALRSELGLSHGRWDQGWQEMLGQVIIPRLSHVDIEQLTKHLGAEHRLVKLTKDLFIEF